MDPVVSSSFKYRVNAVALVEISTVSSAYRISEKVAFTGLCRIRLRWSAWCMSSKSADVVTTNRKGDNGQPCLMPVS